MEYKNNKTGSRRRYKSRYHSPHSYKTKRAPGANRAPILIGVATFLILASLVLVFAFGDNIYTFLDNTFHPSTLPLPMETMGVVLETEAPIEHPTAVALPTEAEPPTEASIDENALFSRLLSSAGLKENELSGSQMIFVESEGTSAKVYFYEKTSGGTWERKFDIVDGYVGTGGIANEVGPYDDTTPVGTYNFEFAFGTNSDPGTALEYNAVTYSTQWITDPSSINYNRMVEAGSTVEDYSSCQQLYEYTKSYPYAVVFDYNRDPVNSSLGCARFLHVASQPTYGGVGISEKALGTILRWLKPEANPTISIF